MLHCASVLCVGETRHGDDVRIEKEISFETLLWEA